MARELFALILALATAGCATQEATFTEVVQRPPPGMASVSITRVAGNYFGALLSASIELNSAKVAELAIGQSHVVSVPPGATVISATMSTISGRYDLHFTAERGKSYRFVVSPRATTAALIGAAVLGGPGAVLGTAAEGNGPLEIRQVQ